MNNPPKRPPVPAGKQAVWVRLIRRGIKKKVQGRWRGYAVIVRRGHWRIISISFKADRSRRAGKAWIPAQAYLKELEIEHDLATADPIYRYHPQTDVVRSLSGSNDPLHNLVWDKPFTADNKSGRFNVIRIWYIVRDTNLKRSYLYSRTADMGNVYAGSLLALDSHRHRLEDAVVEEYDDDHKIYMELSRFVAWTAFEKMAPKSRHKRRLAMSQEKGYDFDPRTWKPTRVLTRWEKKQLMKRPIYHPRMPDVFTRSYGGNIRKFDAAMKRLKPGQRRKAMEYMKWMMSQREAEMDKRRGKR